MSNNYLTSVKNALKILKCFTMDEPEKRVIDISEELDLNKSTVSRTLSTLESEGFVYKNPETNRYRLGLTIVTLSGIVNNNTDIYKESIPVLNELVRSIGETAHISVLDNYEVIYLEKVECNHPVRFLTHVGKRNPLYCTSSGKVLLAFSPKYVLETVIDRGLIKYTNQTITDPFKLRKHIAEIKKKGYAVSYEELSEGVNSIAAPIFDYTGKVVAALSVVGPKQRIDHRKLKEIRQHTINASKEISSRLGYWK